MSVLIKGAEMPKNCCECFAFKANNVICKAGRFAFGKKDAEWLPLRVSDRCPLIELPDHGDLIDRDAVENAALMIWLRNSNGNDAMEQTIEHIRHNIKAVIPAERSEE